MQSTWGAGYLFQRQDFWTPRVKQSVSIYDKTTGRLRIVSKTAFQRDYPLPITSVSPNHINLYPQERCVSTSECLSVIQSKRVLKRSTADC